MDPLHAPLVVSVVVDQFEALTGIRGAWKVTKSTGHTQKCYVRYKEHQNQTTGTRISSYPMPRGNVFVEVSSSYQICRYILNCLLNAF